MDLRLELGNGNRRYDGPMEAGVPSMKSPRLGSLLDRGFMYFERAVMAYALYRVATSDDFKEVVRSRF